MYSGIRDWRVKNKIERVEKLCDKILEQVDSGDVDKARTNAGKLLKTWAKIQGIQGYEEHVTEDLESTVEAMGAFVDGEVDDPRDYGSSTTSAAPASGGGYSPIFRDQIGLSGGSMGRPMGPPMGRPMGPPMGRPMGPPMGPRPMGRPMGRSMGGGMGRPTGGRPGMARTLPHSGMRPMSRAAGPRFGALDAELDAIEAECYGATRADVRDAKRDAQVAKAHAQKARAEQATARRQAAMEHYRSLATRAMGRGLVAAKRAEARTAVEDYELAQIEADIGDIRDVDVDLG